MKGSRGYTLLEILVAFTIMGLVLASVPMMVASGRPGTEARAVAEDLAATLRLARGKAVSSFAPATLTLDVERRAYGMAGEKEKHIGEEIEVNFVTARTELVGEDAGRIRFYPDGSSTGARVTLAAGGRTYVVTVDWLTGIVDLDLEG